MASPGARKARAWWSSPIPGWRSTRRKACSARNSGWSWLPMSRHPAARLAQAARLGVSCGNSGVGPGQQRRRQRGSRPEAARPVRGRRPAAGPGVAHRSGMRCISQPSRRPLALNTTRRTPVDAQQPAQRHRGDRAGRRCGAAARPAAAPAPGGRREAISAVRSRASSRLMRVVVHHVQRITGLQRCGCAPARARRRRPDTGRARRLPRSQGTAAMSASAMARARTGSSPDRSASRITPSGSVCDGPRRPAFQPHHLQRAAADIGQDAVGIGNAAQHALGAENSASSSPLISRDRHARQAGLQAVDEIRPVLRVTHRRGRQHLERRRRPSRAPPRDSGASR